MLLSDKQLLTWNQEGLIPGPDEDNEAFVKRAETCLNLKEIISNENLFPKGLEDVSEPYLKEAFPIIKPLFDLAPTWVPIVFSNEKLSFWHAGAAWIFQLKENDSTTSLLQLRQNWRKSSTYLKIYTRDELIAHELCHAGRMMFEEPKFEEILAYKTSPSAFRRWYGSIIQNSKEAFIFMLSLLILVLISLYAVFTDNDSLYRISSWLQFIPLACAFFGILRLRKRHIQVDKCILHLNEILQDEHLSQAVLYRLTDREIISFSKMTPEKIRDYAQKNKEQSLRWYLLNLAYFEVRVQGDN